METQNIVPSLEFIIHNYLLFLSMQTIVFMVYINLSLLARRAHGNIFIMTVNNTIKLHKMINYDQITNENN